MKTVLLLLFIACCTSSLNAADPIMINEKNRQAEADALFQKGQQEMKLRKYKEARENFKKAHELDPKKNPYKKAYAGASKELGIHTLAMGDHDAALEYLTLAESLASKNDNKLEFMIWLCKNHKLHKGLKPEYAHRILTVFFRRTDAMVTDFNDKPFRIVDEITDDQIKDSEITHKLFKMIIETFTRGRLSLDISTIFVDEPVTGISSLKRPAKKRIVYQPVMGYLPTLGDIVAERINDFDTFFFYWGSGKLNVRSTGGSRSISVIPHTLSSKSRGFVILAGKFTNWNWYSGAYLHEFGHVIETFKVGRTHALYPDRIAETKRLYPDFTGAFEAYWWKYLFEDRIPKRMEEISKASGGLAPHYMNFNFRLRKKDEALKSKYEQCRPLLKGVTIDMLKKARDLYNASNNAKKKGDAGSARQLCAEMYGINPSIARIYETLMMNNCCRLLNSQCGKE